MKCKGIEERVGGESEDGPGNIVEDDAVLHGAAMIIYTKREANKQTSNRRSAAGQKSERQGRQHSSIHKAAGLPGPIW